ncbi:hypothetical protein EDB19DRAFT_1727397, partial [Suillus lakei]
MMAQIWILATIWEVFAMCLAAWIVVKHFRELQPPSTGWTIGNCFTVLMETRILYFAVALLLYLASTLAFCLQRSWYADLCDSSDLTTHIFTGLIFRGSLDLLWCSPTCYTHADVCGEATPRITLSSWSTPRKEL